METLVSSSKDLPEEVLINLSDLHLGEGPRLPNGKRNLLEEFGRDREFAAFVREMQEKYKDVPRLCLQLDGDIVDSQSVLFFGRNYDIPYEAVGKYKIKRIIRAHPIFFNALSWFLSIPGRTVDYFKGNHDFFVEWLSVQRLIVKRITKGDKELEDKIRFLDSEDHRGVHYFHGHLDPASATNYNEKFITHRFGLPLKRPVLNYPYGTFLTIEYSNVLKPLLPHIGRLRKNSYIWKYSLLKDWGFGLRALALWVWVLIYNRVFAPFWDVRRKAKFSTTIKLLLWSITGYDLTDYARRIFKERQDIRVVICGHDHLAMRATLQHGTGTRTYINTGTWIISYDENEQPTVYTWKSFRFLEKLVKGVRNFFTLPNLVQVERLTFALVEHYADGAMNARLMEFRPKEPQGKRIREVL